MPGTGKLRLATASLAGCFGCHMSFLDIDERILELIEVVEFDRTPLTDIKTIGECDVGLIEGGVANEENVEVLREFRKHCKVLVAIGACAVNGGIPAMRNQFELEDCLREAYIDGVGVANPGIPNDPEIPLLLNKIDEGYDLVHGWRKHRKDAFLNRRLPSIIANKIISWTPGVALHDYGCTLKAFRKEVT